MNYQGKNIFITGVYSGIGKELLNYYVKHQANVIVTYHNHKKETLDLLREYDVNIDLVYLDLTDELSIKKTVDFVREKYGKIDILINNAALSLDSFIMDKMKDEFMKVLETNVVGTFLMMKYFDSIVDGYIFNISSTDGVDTGNVYSIDYNASKAAINNMTKTFSLYSKNKIISLCPNWVDTESTRKMNKEYLESELKRIGQKKLINPCVIPLVIDKCIGSNYPSGSIIRIEGEDDVRRID